LVLSRRNERRAEERRNDKSRDCKFGSHQKCLHGFTEPLQTSTGDFVPARDEHCANFMFNRNGFIIAAPSSVTFPTSVTFRTQDLRKAVSLVRSLRHITKCRARPNRGDAECSRRVPRVLAAQNAEKRCHCGSSSLKDRVSIRRLLNARNAMTLKPWWRRYPLQ
jgi:hypothetical protein